MRGSESVMKLVKATAVVLAFKITLDGLKKLLDTLKSGVQGCDLILRGKLLQKFRLPGLVLGCLAFHILEDVGGRFVGKLETTAEVDELGGNSVIQDSVSSRWVGNCVLLLFLVPGGLLLGSAHLGGDDLALTGGRLQNKLEDLEGIGVLGCGSCDTEGVSRGESDLLYLSMGRLHSSMLETYLVCGEADLVVHGNLKSRGCVLQFHD